MAEAEVTALKEALYDQYIIMKKLYAELEEEREASATAASETLSVILRLQREKAAEKMESCQYKRMAEEKMHHAEECLEFLEEVIQQNEMEISSLMYQLEIYKQKLARHGVNIPDVGQMSICEERSLTGSNVLTDKTSFPGFVRRNVSLPSLLQLDQWCPEMETKYDETELVESFDPVRKQAEELNKKLKELMQAKNAKEVVSCSGVATTELLRPLSVGSSDQESGSYSWYSAGSGVTSCDSTTGGIQRKSDDQAVSCLRSQVRGSDNVPKFAGPSSSCLEAQSNGKTVHPAGVHDIFEISENHKDSNPYQPFKKVLEESVHEANNISGMPSLMPQESIDCLFRGDDRLNKAFMNGHYGNKSSPPRKAPFLQHGGKLPTPSKGTSLGCHWSLGDPKVEIGTSQVDFEQLKLRLKQLEKERTVMQEDTERSKEQLTLLRNIFKQLNTIETHIKRSTSKKYSAHNDSKVVSVMEAVLSFSI